jgi:hypothetical protein
MELERLAVGLKYLHLSPVVAGLVPATSIHHCLM